MLGSGTVDAVCVCVPNSLHAQVAVAAAKRGLHVLVEKPMAVSGELAGEMAQAAAKAGVVLAVKVHNRFRRSSAKARELIASGALGRIYRAEVECYRRDFIPGMGTWFTRRRLSGGGTLVDSGIHGLDGAMWLLGFPAVAAVTGVVSNRIGASRAEPGQVFDVEDSAFAFIRAAEGVSVSFASTWAGYRDEAEVIRILGEKGGLAVNWGFATDSVRLLGATPEQDQVFDYTPAEGAMAPWQAAHRQATHQFLAAAAQGLPSPVDPAGSVAVTRLCDLIYASAEAGAELAWS
jgi:predicted dehydrogenase